MPDAEPGKSRHQMLDHVDTELGPVRERDAPVRSHRGKRAHRGRVAVRLREREGAVVRIERDRGRSSRVQRRAGKPHPWVRALSNQCPRPGMSLKTVTATMSANIITSPTACTWASMRASGLRRVVAS